MSIIAQVIEAYGRYDASLERRFNGEQQKAAPQLEPMRKIGHVYERQFVEGVRAALQARPEQWWDYWMLIRHTGFKEGQLRQAVRQLTAAGEIEQRMMPKTTRGGSYRAMRLRQAAA